MIARRHWARWLPAQYAAISDPESFFTALGEEAARRIDDLTEELVGEIRHSDSYLACVGRLFAAHAIAEELILPQRVLPQAELAADSDQEHVTSDYGERLRSRRVRLQSGHREASEIVRQHWTVAGASAITTLRCEQASRSEDQIWTAPRNQTPAA